MKQVKAKKHLGQHFLNSESIAKDIVELIGESDQEKWVLEIGPGMGVLTKYLLENEKNQLSVVEIDTESVEYLKTNYPALAPRIIDKDFLRLRLDEVMNEHAGKTLDEISIIGNFPYNISSQIFFKVLDYRNYVTEVVCMLQKEVAQRIASPKGNKDYGILSVLLQAFYDIEYHFTVYPNSFNPPPKVDSGVIRLVRNQRKQLDCDEKLFFTIVKVGFNQRRKMLRNPLKALGVQVEHPFMVKRAEQLSVEDFIELTKIYQAALANK